MIDYGKKGYKIAIFAMVLALMGFSIGGLPGQNGTNGTNGTGGLNGTNGADGTNGSNGINGTNGTNSIGGGLNYYLHPTNSTILNSKIMDTTLNLSGSTRYINYTSLPTGTTLIQNWSSPPINVTLIPAGAYNLHLDALKIGGSGNHAVKLFYEIGLTNSTGGNYSIIGTSEVSSEILITAPYTEADMLLFSQTKNTNTTDRLLLKLYAVETGTGLLPELQIQYGGMTDAYLSIPSEAFTSQDIINIVQPSLDLKLNKSGDNITNVTGISMLSSPPSFGLYKVNTSISDGIRPYQINLTVSNSTGTNNVSWIYCNGHCNQNFTDIRFTLDGITLLPYWIENTTTGLVWVNVTANGTVNMYYGNTNAVSLSNGTNTFLIFSDGTTLTGTTQVTSSGYSAPTWSTSTDGRIKANGGATSQLGYLYFDKKTGVSNYIMEMSVNSSVTGNYEPQYGFRFDTTTSNVLRGASIYLETESLNKFDIVDSAGSGTYSATQTRDSTKETPWKFIKNGNNRQLWENNTLRVQDNESWDAQTVGLYFYDGTQGTTTWYRNFKVRNYASPEPTWSTWGTETSVQSIWCVRVSSLGVLYTTSGTC